ncbi:MAG: pilus assembly protein PilM [Abditibacteriales bacterium]|nr:pilus assembly protein PilM [Abditibacteriales bacterium]MDW8364976.1 pilus assembly protein PilM [Abditibacteriales bacterium]
MLRRRGSITGLDISQRWLRVVEVRATPQGIFLERMGVHATPAGAVMRGYVVDPQAVGAAARTLYESHGIKTRSVVMGVPASHLASRISQVPAVSPREMYVLAQGEVEHFRLLPQGEGTFDYVRLRGAGDPNGDEAETTSILLMAMEEQLVNTYIQVAKAADLQLLALEPTSIASLRALYPALLRQVTTALVAVDDNSTTLSIVQNGTLCYYRVLEGGVLRLGEVPGQVEELALELQRSLDFYHREMHTGELVSHIQLALDTTQFRDLERFLSEQLGMPVETRHPFAHVPYNTARIAADFLEEVGPSFTTAFGLALHDVDDALILQPAAGDGATVVRPEQVREIPRIDLSTREREKVMLRLSHRGLLISVGISILIALFLNFAAGVANSFTAQRQSELTKVEAELTQVTQRIKQQQTLVDQMTAAMGKAREYGPPYAQTLIRLSAAMPSGTWITSLSRGADGHTRIVGKAVSPFVIANTLRQLGKANLPGTPRLISMSREGDLFAFDIQVQPR